MNVDSGWISARMLRCGAAIVLVAAAIVATTGWSSGDSGPVHIVVSPSSATYYVPVSTTISGLPAGARATVTASALDAQNQDWTSSAVFLADGQGIVSLAQPSVGGSYQGPDPMGLVETLAPPQPPNGTLEHFTPPSGANGFDVELSVSVAGQVLATTTMTRNYIALKPQVETLAATGVYGDLFLPAHQSGPKPAVLVFGGSEGGLALALQAAQIADQGYPALAVAYFQEPGLPSTLSNIPLEYFVNALHLLAKQPGVDPNHLLVWGTSRGSEAALLLGAHFPNLVHGVIAGVPSSVVWGSYPAGSAAWTLDGKPLPYAPLSDWNQPDPPDAQDAVIPVEQINGPIFLVCGGADQVWVSCPFTDAITSRLARHDFGYPVTALHYPAAGHYGGDLLPYLPFADAATPTDPISTGGTELSDEQAEANSWPQLLTFLHDQ